MLHMNILLLLYVVVVVVVVSVLAKTTPELLCVCCHVVCCHVCCVCVCVKTPTDLEARKRANPLWYLWVFVTCLSVGVVNHSETSGETLH